jgi:hypothetical protein
MRARLAAATLAALLLPAAAAQAAGDPIMPLGEVQSGMQCTGYSVVRGTDIASFGVEVVDVVDDKISGTGPRILVKASGPAVDETGIGPGFSGSPIYCDSGTGGQRVIGAISESIGEYGGKVVLATPIEQIVGTPVDAPHAGTSASTTSLKGRRILARSKPLAAPLTIGGLSPRLGAALEKAAAKRGRVVLATPAGPLGSFPVQQLRPGSAFGVGYSDGDIPASAIGTVSYTDGDRVWGFGHPLDGVGARALLLQDAYVFRVINNPIAIGDSIGSYKYAAPGHTIGTLTSDGLNAVAGRVGAAPPTIPVEVVAKDRDTGQVQGVHTNVADESGVDEPTGGTLLTLLAPLAVSQAGGAVLGGSPARLTGDACFTIGLREASKPVRFCNRYVSDIADPLSGNTVAGAASTDLYSALSLVDFFRDAPVHVTSVTGSIEISRGQDQAFLRKVKLPRKAKSGAKVTATLVLRHVRGAREVRNVTVQLPHNLRPGRHKLVFEGPDTDFSGGDLFEFFDIFLDDEDETQGPTTVKQLAKAMDSTGRYDGVTVKRAGRRKSTQAYRAGDLRITGRVKTAIRITKTRH